MRLSFLPLLLVLVVACDPAGGGEEPIGNECEAEPWRCWCPNPQCERRGCIDGVAYNCRWYGDCSDQLPPDDCGARGETCWQTSEGAEAVCRPAGCGDGIVQEGEACDDGAANGTRLDACTTSCSIPPVAVLDQRNAAADGELTSLRYVKNSFAAFQTFTASKSGRLAWIVADVEYGGLFVLNEDGGWALLAPSVHVSHEVEGRYRSEHHFLEPARVEAGRQYAFALQCGDPSGCDLQVTSGDRYAGGGLVFRAYPNRAEVADAPADLDLPFETWGIEEDDGCAPADAPLCSLSCEEWGAAVRPSCVAGVWDCGDYIDRASCIPRNDGPLELVAEVRGSSGETLVVDTSVYEPWLGLRVEEGMELARLELPGSVFEPYGGGVAVIQGDPNQRPVTYLRTAEGYRPTAHADYVFDFVPPLALQAGESYAIELQGASGLPLVTGDGAASLLLVPWVGRTAPELPEGTVIPFRIWRSAGE